MEPPDNVIKSDAQMVRIALFVHVGHGKRSSIN